MSDLIKRLKAVRDSVAYEAGHIDEWHSHDHMCADVADEAADRIKELEGRNERLTSRSNANWILATKKGAEIEELQSQLAQHQAIQVQLYNQGYHAGHHDTVEGGYTDIYPCDMDSYHEEEVVELVSDLLADATPPEQTP